MSNLAFAANVVTPATETLSKFVWPSTSNSTKSPLPTNVVPWKLVPVTTPAILTLSKFVCPSTFKSWVMVVKPEILILSKCVWPSISTSAFISMFPLKVDIPD